jgi:tRNA (guanine-N7-)-methyltransferase
VSEQSQSLLYELPSILQRLDLSKVFPVDQPLEVELGSGDGTFLVDLAKSRLDHIHWHRTIARPYPQNGPQSSARWLINCAARIESSYFLEHLLPLHSVEVTHLLSRPVAETQTSPPSAD